MGNSYSSARGQWWYGTSSLSSTTYQDDLAVIADTSTNGFGYRADDHSNTIYRPDPLTISGSTSVSGAGIIERMSDVDAFSFATGAGAISFTVDVAADGPTLDLKVQLFDSIGGLIATSDTAALGEILSVTVSGGWYRLVVGSHGGYGDIGQYSISGTVLPSDGTPDMPILSFMQSSA